MQLMLACLFLLHGILLYGILLRGSSLVWRWMRRRAPIKSNLDSAPVCPSSTFSIFRCLFKPRLILSHYEFVVDFILLDPGSRYAGSDFGASRSPDSALISLIPQPTNGPRPYQAGKNTGFKQDPEYEDDSLGVWALCSLVF
jgi:hypothetical protein